VSELVAVRLPPQGRDFPTAASLGQTRLGIATADQVAERQYQALAEPLPPHQTFSLATQNLTLKKMGD